MHVVVYSGMFSMIGGGRRDDQVASAAVDWHFNDEIHIITVGVA